MADMDPIAALEHDLRSLSIDWPETPEIAAAVLTRLSDQPHPAGAARRRGFPSWRTGFAWATALLVIAFGITMAASPSARSAVLEWLGLRSARIERREPDAPPAGRRAPLGADLGLGEPMSLERARERAGFRILPPVDPGLGEPDAVYVDQQSRVALVYGPRPGIPRSKETGAGLLVTEFPAVVTPVIEKAVGEGARVEQLELDGAPAIFISGAHGFAYLDQAGNPSFEDQRLAGNTLLVERADGLLLRIEGEVSRERAVQIASSVR